MNYPTLDQVDIKGKTVLMRAGFDLPLDDGVIVDTSRVEAVLPTMKYILDAGAALILMAHQGRPKAKPLPEMSQKSVIPVLEKLLGVEIQFADSCIGADTKAKAAALQPGQVLLLENLRYEAGEKENDPAFAKELADLGDIYVNDAFTNSHRSHASMIGVPTLIPGYLGLHIANEIEQLSKVTNDPAKPVTLIISGAKMETKIPVIENFLTVGDNILVGGCIANTCIAAQGFDVGTSLYQQEWMQKAQDCMLMSESEDNATLHVPTDVILATEPKDHAEKLCLPVKDIMGDMAIYDIGKNTIDHYKEIIAASKTIVWNGPMGMHEHNCFSHATKRIAEAITDATKNGAVSIVGGGDTLDFHERYNYSLDVYTHVSTAGGAMLDFISGKTLPGLQVLQEQMVSRS